MLIMCSQNPEMKRNIFVSIEIIHSLVTNTDIVQTTVETLQCIAVMSFFFCKNVFLNFYLPKKRDSTQRCCVRAYISYYHFCTYVVCTFVVCTISVFGWVSTTVATMQWAIRREQQPKKFNGKITFCISDWIHGN